MQIRKHLLNDGVTIRTADYVKLIDEEERREANGYRTYRSYHSTIRGQFVIKMRRGKGQMERWLERDGVDERW